MQPELKFHKIVSDSISTEIMNIVPEMAIIPESTQLSRNDTHFCFFTSFATNIEIASRVTISEATQTYLMSMSMSKIGLESLCPAMLIFMKLALLIC